MKSENPFLHCVDVLDDRKRVRAILLDCFPTERVKANVLVSAYDCGIISAIRDSEIIDDALINRLEKRLITDYAINSDMAQWAVRFWVEMYGVEILRKTMLATTGYSPGSIKDDNNIDLDNGVLLTKKNYKYTAPAKKKYKYTASGENVDPEIYNTFFDGKNAGYDQGYELGFFAGYDTGKYDFPNKIPESPQPKNYAFSNGFQVGFSEGYDKGYEEGCKRSGHKNELEKLKYPPYNSR